MHNAVTEQHDVVDLWDSDNDVKRYVLWIQSVFDISYVIVIL